MPSARHLFGTASLASSALSASAELLVITILTHLATVAPQIQLLMLTLFDLTSDGIIIIIIITVT